MEHQQNELAFFRACRSFVKNRKPGGHRSDILISCRCSPRAERKASGSGSADIAPGATVTTPAVGDIGDVVRDSDLEQLVSGEPPPATAAPSAAGAAPATDAGEIGIEELASLAARCVGTPTQRPTWPQELAAGQDAMAWRGDRGRMLWDASAGAPAPHIRRLSGDQPVLALNAGRKIDFRKWALAGAPLGRRDATPDGALRSLLGWLSARPAIRDGVYKASVQAPPGVDFGVGWWVRLDLAGVRPGAPDSVATDMRRSFHGTAMATLARIVQVGVRTGFAENTAEGRLLKGIWSLAPERSRLLTSYILYSALDRSGFVFGPVVELRSPIADPQGRRIVLKRGSGARNRDQWISYDDTTTQVAIWIHAFHISELAAADQASAFSVFAEGRIPPELEIHPDDAWEAICRRSEAAATGA